MNVQKLHHDYLNMMSAPTYNNMIAPQEDHNENDNRWVEDPQTKNSNHISTKSNPIFLFFIILYFSILLHCIVQWVLHIMSLSACSFIVYWFPLSFTTCFGLHGHLQECRILWSRILLCSRQHSCLLRVKVKGLWNPLLISIYTSPMCLHCSMLN
jgi:hypothetical protein